MDSLDLDRHCCYVRRGSYLFFLGVQHPQASPSGLYICQACFTDSPGVESRSRSGTGFKILTNKNDRDVSELVVRPGELTPVKVK